MAGHTLLTHYTPFSKSGGAICYQTIKKRWGTRLQAPPMVTPLIEPHNRPTMTLHEKWGAYPLNTLTMCLIAQLTPSEVTSFMDTPRRRKKKEYDPQP